MSRYQKGKINLDFTGARDSEWQWHQLGHMQVCTSLLTDNHASTPPLSFFTGRVPFLPPNQQRQSTGGANIPPPAIGEQNIAMPCLSVCLCVFLPASISTGTESTWWQTLLHCSFGASEFSIFCLTVDAIVMYAGCGLLLYLNARSVYLVGIW